MSTTILPFSPFPQTPFSLENEEREEALTNSLTSSTTTRARAREELERYYCDTFGAPKAPPVAVRQMDYALEQEMSPEVIMTAIDEAALAPRPSWAYARAIIQRLLAEGVRTPEEYAKRQAKFYSRRSRDFELPF